MALPPLHSFRVFESVARLGNVGAAAAELHVTPGAVSQQIRALQTALGVDLFQKRGRQIALTDSGALLQRSASTAIEAIEAGVRQVAAQKYDEAAGRTLTISIPQLHGISWLATRLFTLMAGNPNLKLTVLTASHFPGVDWRRADVAIVYGAPPWPGFWWRLLHGIRMTPVCSPQLLRGPKAIRKPADLAHHRLLHEDDGSQWRRWQAEAGIAYTRDTDVYFEDFGIVLQAARDGFGVALSDEVVSARDLDEGRLVQPLQLSVPAIHNYYCLCSEAKRDRPEVDYFIDWLIGEATSA